MIGGLSITLKLGESVILNNSIRLTFAHAKKYEIAERGSLYRYEFFYLDPINRISKLVVIKELPHDNEYFYIDSIDCYVTIVLSTKYPSTSTVARLCIKAPKEISINRECIELLDNVNFYSNYKNHAASLNSVIV